MANRSKQKGDRFERAVVALFTAAGFRACRVPLSGAAGGEFSDDVEVSWFNGETGKFECKSRAHGFTQIYKWLGSATGLFVRADRKPAIVILRSSDFFDLMKRAHASEKAQRQKGISAEADPDAERLHDAAPGGGCL